MPYTKKDWTLGDSITEVDLDRIETGIQNVTDAVEDDSGWMTSGITAAGAWTISSQRWRRVGDSVCIYLLLTRNTSTWSVGASGNPTNSPVATLPASIRPSENAALASGGSGQMASFFISGGDKILYACATSPDRDVPVGGELSVGGMYFL